MYKIPEEVLEICDIKENYDTGWIKLYRSIKKHWIWENPLYFQMWVDFLMRANHKEAKILFDDELVTINRGEFITSQLKLADEYRSSRSKIRHFLGLLKRDSMIEQNCTKKMTKITICNYDAYQDSRPTESQLKANRKPTESQQKDINKNDKNEKNENNNMDEIKSVKTEYFLDVLPITLTQQQIEAWNEWVDYRKEIRKKLTKRSAKMQVEFLLSQPDLIKCIRQSIQNQWTGLFEVKNGTNKQSNSKGADGDFLRTVIERRAAKERG